MFFIRLVLCALLILALPCYAKDQAPLLITICVADHNKAPLFINARSEIPIINSQAQINTLKKLDLAIGEVNFQYQTQPWQVCITKLKQGSVDAFISGYSSVKGDYAVFPVDKDAKPISQYSLAKMSQCLLGKRRFHTKWQSREVFQSKAFSLAVANGHFVGDAASEEGFFIEHTFTLQTAVNRVADDSVDAAIVLCKIENNKLGFSQYQQYKLAPVFPPINTSQAYLAFSNEFFHSHKNIANRVWQQIAKTRLADVYATMLKRINAEQHIHIGAK